MRRKYYFSIGAIVLLATSSLAFGTENNESENKTSKNTSWPKPNVAINTYTYNTAVGVRGIGTSGLTIKYFNSSSTAFEGILGLGPDAFSITLLYETYTNAFDEPGLYWYYGVGGHLATQTDWVYYDGIRGYRREKGDLGIGVDGIFGIEYKINEVPIAVSLDVKPFLEVTTNGDAYLALDPGLGVKFTF